MNMNRKLLFAAIMLLTFVTNAQAVPLNPILNQ